MNKRGAGRGSTAFCAVHITKSTSFLGVNKMILADLGDDDQSKPRAASSPHLVHACAPP
jgi:hypothetical protein